MANILPSSRASIPATSIGQDPPRNRAGKLLRKRVKTGCLTCRKRRIKCGEQKPSCFNCIKSKRDCDYNARLVFKDYPPLGEAISPEFPHEFDQASFAPLSASIPQPAFPRNDYAPFSTPLTPQTPSYGHYVQAPLTTPLQPSFPQHVTQQGNYQSYPTSTASYQPFPSALLPVSAGPLYGPVQGYRAPSIPQEYAAPSLHAPQWQTPLPRPDSTQWETTGSSVQHPMYDTTLGTAITSADLEPSLQAPAPAKRIDAHSNFSPPSISSSSAGEAKPAYARSSHTPWYQQPDHNAMLEMAAVEIEDDDYFDVLPEEEMHEPSGALHACSANTVHGTHAPTTRAMPGFSTNMAFYNEAQAASPLKNKATQMIFRNFIWHTAPALSICERPAAWAHRIVPPSGMTGSPMSCWMDVLPSMAMQDPGLLHAMLAQSSYGIAKTNGASTTSSVRHHAWSMKRVHRALDSPRKRHSVTTLAATLLLGFYEILTADHMKWSTHLSGARHLIMETNFRGMADELRRRLRNSSTGTLDQAQHAWGHDSAESMVDLYSTNDPLVEELMGFRVGPTSEQDWRHRYVNADLHNFATRQDLFWWYCKQDVYHSMISGNDLLLPFNRWVDCPPRAAMGRLDAVYGSVDYMVLLMGRIASFAANDRPRKLRAAKANTPPPPSSATIPHTPATPSPTFYGMAPSSGQPQGHSAFGPQIIGTVSNDRHMYSTTAQVEALTVKATADWNDIRAACDLFVHRLGPDFQPLTPEEYPPFDTPFGPSCHFRSYDVAALWIMYYTGLIALIRSHPSKHAAAHVSIGTSAKETSWYANEVGRIAAGITSPGLQSEHHFKYLGANTCTIVPLFFAGAQYQDPEQRRWTVERLIDIYRKTGWTTAETCANGCETSWVKAAEMKRGAPWQRIGQDVFSTDQRSSGKYIHLNGGKPVDADDRRQLHYQPDSRLLWGFGLLGTTEDLGHIAIND